MTDQLDPAPWEVVEDDSRHPFEKIHAACGDWEHLLCQLALWRPRPNYSQKIEDYK